MTFHGASNSRPFEFTRKNFDDVAKYARRNFGLHLPESKMQLVYSRLARRVRALGLADFETYLQFLHDADGQHERSHILSALTTNVTHFFREKHHFETLTDVVLPPLIAQARKGGRVRIWSAGCSTGQEPYSIALSIMGLCPEAPSLDIKVLATDIDPIVVEHARNARYDADLFDPVPADLRLKYVDLSDRCSGQGVIREPGRSLLSFGVLNLIEPFPFRGPLDAIFCRNVAIYFDKATQQLVWSQFADVLGPGGYLFIGHSERLSGDSKALMKPVGVTTYTRYPLKTKLSIGVST